MNEHKPHSESGKHAEEAAGAAKSIVEDLKSAAVAKAGEAIEAGKAQVVASAEELVRKVQSSSFVADAEKQLREEPLKVLLVTFGLGVFVGMVLRR